MSTITKELAKLFRKITNSEIDAEGNAHVVLSPADSLLINNARIALASLEAEAVACIDRANLDYLESGADADVWPASGAGSDDVLLYAAPQLPQTAVLSVPDKIPKLKDGRGYKYVKDGVRYSVNYASGWNACRAAMLKGSEPVSQPYTLPPLDYLDTVKFNADCAIQDPDSIYTNEFFLSLDEVFGEMGNYSEPVQAKAVSMLIAEIFMLRGYSPAEPQQEVKSAFEHGMQRYAGAMQKLSEGDK
ncbi:hypothetical protein MW376_000245 [Citrobacter freundii]|nr:hypothetical protein [Citrobacter freundii]EJB8558155.1 hypothetical protein [Citrobacter freundii]